MIYLVTANLELYQHDDYKIISPEESIKMMDSWDVIQYDSETDGRDAHINNLLSIQFGNKKTDTQIVVDCSNTDVLLYKEVLENNYIMGHNLKFDLQFLYNYGIIPRMVYDTMIVEQFLHLGFPPGQIGYSLKDVAYRYLGIDIDKTVRGEIIWRGLDASVVKYAAGDVMYLEDIAEAQYKECVAKNCIIGAQLECNAVPAVAYLEWSGIMLDEKKWKEKMANDQVNLKNRKQALDNFIINKADTNDSFKHFTFVDNQGDLWTGFDLTPKCTINWDSSQQTIQVAKLLGFDTTVQDKKTGEDKDSVLEKTLRTQKGINDEFLKLYFDYKESSKVVSTYGQGHLNAINPKTGRLHTIFRQLGTASGRFSCGSNQPNQDLAKYKKISPAKCTYLNLQQLPSDAQTRGAFVAPEGSMMVSADFSAEELKNTVLYIKYQQNYCYFRLFCLS